MEFKASTHGCAHLSVQDTDSFNTLSAQVPQLVLEQTDTKECRCVVQRVSQGAFRTATPPCLGLAQCPLGGAGWPPWAWCPELSAKWPAASQHLAAQLGDGRAQRPVASPPPPCPACSHTLPAKARLDTGRNVLGDRRHRNSEDRNNTRRVVVLARDSSSSQRMIFLSYLKLFFVQPLKKKLDN